MRDEPLVSVIINNYNYGHFVGMAIDSALNQTYRSIEVIVVDDGSTNHSRDVLAGYRDRIRLVAKENAGQASALNAGYTASKGDVICFLDADDTWFPTKINRVIERLNAQPQTAWLRHKLEIVDENLQPTGRHLPTFRGSNPIPPIPYLYLERVVTVSTSALALRRSIGPRIFPIPEPEFRYDADAYIITCLGAERVSGYSLDEVLGYYRRHQAQRFRTLADAKRMLDRQNHVALAVGQVWSNKTGIEHIASSVFKHQLITTILDGQPVWARERWANLAEGLRQISKIAPHCPRLAARQTIALLYAFGAPRNWLQRLLARHGLVL